ncbi:hypothetical protein M404DRAFT_19932 [Pisolithus tinctorius Marx 270]|uniref:Zn(2)-C6 fungal-type domain-containing protein n=1 Tax=Pisolithus tinctorius Marx 270 TaxID=870435 RepID=A0A0C3PE81_PISTI|nr:hypothetical protein M404DRAFT_19932 [Pisolithus tinctorius Marx 270]
MSKARLIVTADNNNEGWAIINWTQVPDDKIRYDTDDEEEAKAGKGNKAGAGGSKAGKVKKVVMDPGCMRCAWAQVVCKFLMDSNKKWVACVHCNQSKGKCQWPGDRKDSEAGPKVTYKVNKGKKQKADDGMPEPRLSQRKWAKSKLIKVLEIDEPEASGNGVRKVSAGGPLGLEDKLKQLINVAGLIANNLAGLFELHETMVENLGHIADALQSILDKSYGFRVAVTPLDSGSSKFDLDELHEEAEWLKTHGKDEEEGTEGEDEAMAEGEHKVRENKKEKQGK